MVNMYGLDQPPKRQNTIAESEFMSLANIICKPAVNSSHKSLPTIKFTSFPEEKNPTSNHFIHQKTQKKHLINHLILIKKYAIVSPW